MLGTRLGMTSESYSAFVGVCPGHSPTRRIMIRLEEEYFGADLISVWMVPRTSGVPSASLPNSWVSKILLPLQASAKAKPFLIDLMSETVQSFSTLFSL